MIIFNLFLIGLIGILIFIIRNLLKLNTQYEEYIQNLSEDYYNSLENVRVDTKSSLQIMKEIDINGVFEKDDEVGVVFDQMKQTIEELNKKLESYAQKKED